MVDGSGYIFRAYWAIRSLTNSAGEATNAVYGFANMLEKLLREEAPDHLCVVFDAGTETFRNELYPPYKATRPPPPEDLQAQIPEIHNLVAAMGIRSFAVEGVEADDVIATLVQQGRAENYEVRLISGDKDLMQLVTAGVMLFEPMKGETFDAAGVEDKLGVPPELVADALALAGDSADNVPGVKGVGLKTAAKLLLTHGSLEAVLEAAQQGQVKGKVGATLADSVEQARLSRRLVGLKPDVELGLTSMADLAFAGPERSTLISFYRSMEFDRLIERWETSTASRPEDRGGAQSRIELSADVPILSAAEFEGWADAASKAGFLAVELELTTERIVDAELVGMAISIGDDAGYIPVRHDEIANVDEDGVASFLTTMLGSNVRIVCSQSKLLWGWLMMRGLPGPDAFFDTTIASYLLDPDQADHDPEGVAKRLFDAEPEPKAPALRKDRKRRPFSSVEPNRAARIVGHAAQVSFHAEDPLRQAIEEEGLTGVYNDIELPLVRVLARMEQTGIKVDLSRLAEMKHVLRAELERLEVDCYEAAGREFNVGSPKQLEQILFDELELKIVKRTATGRPSTDHSVLEALADSHPLPQAVLEHRLVSKLKSTYVDALPRMVSSNTGRVHTHFNQTMAATGRLSSTDPNLQNIPIRTELGRQLRTVFVADSGMRLISVDYSQVELRVLAHFTKEPVLVEAFMEGADVHTRTAALLFEVPDDQVTREMRTQAKAVNFGVLYGMGPMRLARDLKIPRRQASTFIDDYFARQPAVKTFIDEVMERARSEGMVRTLMGRLRRIQDLDAKSRAARAAAERIARNTPIQGSAADLIKLAMLRVDADLRERFPTARLVLQVHDELLVEAEADQAQDAAELVQRQMQNAFPLEVPLVAEPHIGETWDEAH